VVAGAHGFAGSFPWPAWLGGDWLAISDSPVEPLALWHTAALLVAGLVGWPADWRDCAGVDLEDHHGPRLDVAGAVFGLRLGGDWVIEVVKYYNIQGWRLNLNDLAYGSSSGLGLV